MTAAQLVVAALALYGTWDLTRRHLRCVNRMLAADTVAARRQRDEWAAAAHKPPDARDWVRRADVIRLAHIAEQAEAVAAENRELRRQLAHGNGGST